MTATPTIKRRNSNLELYRIIVMFIIVLHHYVVNSGLYNIIENEPQSISSTTMLILGGWGKVGINCFVLITGYFLCQSNISWLKLLKLYLQITFYTVIIYCIFCYTGHEKFSIIGFIKTFIPIQEIDRNFTSCFLVFYLFIPFINILIANINQKSHMTACALLIGAYSLLPTIPTFHFSFNYISWFICIYLIASYIRIYGLLPKVTHSMWGWISFSMILLGGLSIYLLEYLCKNGYWHNFVPYFFISDCNKILALLPAISSFMYFKDIRIPESKFINTIGATTFGILLIHANSDAMREFLWKDTIDVIGHYNESLLLCVGYTIGASIIIFVVCSGIDWFRTKYIEPSLLKFFSNRIDRFILSKRNN